MELKLIHDYTTGIEGELEAQARLTCSQIVAMFDEYEINPYMSRQANKNEELLQYHNIIEELRGASR